MKRRGSINIIMLLFFFISLVLGVFTGVCRLFNREDRSTEIRTPGYRVEKGEIQDIMAIPAPEHSLPEKEKPEKKKRKPYVIGGIGKRGTVVVDLPEKAPISMDTSERKQEKSIELPPQLEEIASRAKEQLDAFDEATKKTVQAVMKSLNIDDVTPDKATIRPSGGGFQLNVSIPVGED